MRAGFQWGCNPCLSHNGGCRDLCLYRGRQQWACVCGDGAPHNCTTGGGPKHFAQIFYVFFQILNFFRYSIFFTFRCSIFLSEDRISFRYSISLAPTEVDLEKWVQFLLGILSWMYGSRSSKTAQQNFLIFLELGQGHHYSDPKSHICPISINFK